jgi:hypothetical protein
LGPPKWDKESKAKAKAYYTERFGDGSVFAKRTEGSVANAIFDRWAAEDQRLVEVSFLHFLNERKEEIS